MRNGNVGLKRTIASMLAVLLVLFTVDLSAWAADANEVYDVNEVAAAVDGVTHVVSDSLSFEEALAIATDGDTIDISQGATVLTSEGQELVPLVIDKSVTITGGELVVRKAGVLLEADVTFQNMSLGLANNCHDAIWANGHTLTIDGVKCTSRKADLFGGSLYTITEDAGSKLYSSESGGPGSAGAILVKGTNSGFGNIYAGSMNGTFGASVDIQLDTNLNDGTGTVVYCSGALEGIYDPDNFLDPYYQPDAPVANESAFPATGNVCVKMTYLFGVTVNGATGATSNAEVCYTDGGKGYACRAVLNSIGILSLNGETATKPHLMLDADSVIASDLVINLPANSLLDLTDFASDYNFVIGALEGGGTLVLNSEQVLSIARTVSGTTGVAIGSVEYDGVSSSGTVYREHVYIKAAQSVADDVQKSFVLLPPGGEEVDFVRDDNGDWWVPVGELMKIISVNTVLENVVLTVSMGDADAVIALLPDVIEVTIEGDELTGLAIEWSCDNFNTADGAVNTFTWIVPESETDGWLDRGEVVLTGAITVTNPGNAPEIPAKQPIEVVSAVAADREYDETNVVQITGLTISGVRDGDDVRVSLDGVNGTIESPMAGTYDEVMLPVLALEGEDAAGYLLVQPEGAVPTQVTISKAMAVITAQNDVYEKIYGDAPFVIAEDISVIGEGSVIYGVSEGVDAEGLPKETSDIVTVSQDGTVTVHGSGRVTLTLDMAETDNYKAANTQSVSIVVNAWDDVSRNGFFVHPLETFVYNGKAIKPEPVVCDGNSETRLVMGRDYTITYKNNTKAYIWQEGDEAFDGKKAPTMIIKGKGNYDQNLTVYFTILPKDISDTKDATIVAQDMIAETNGKVQKKTPEVRFNGKKLGKSDFTVDYVEETPGAYKEPGTYPVVITGKGNFAGSRTVQLIVATKDTNLARVSISKIPAQEFDGVNAVELDDTKLVVTVKTSGGKITLQRGVHYDVDYVNNKGIGTATVIISAIEGSGYAGYKKATFKITGTSIAKAKVEGLVNQTYDGSRKEPALRVVLSNKDVLTDAVVTEELKEGVDYTVVYNKNIDVGTATVIIQGMGKYTGTIKKQFKIVPAEIAQLVDVSDGDITAKFVKGGVCPAPRLVLNGIMLEVGKDYTVTYKNNRQVYTARPGESGYVVGKAPTIVIKGKGNFKGTVSRTFVIEGRGLTDDEVPVTMTVNDKVVSASKGGYISKVVLTDADGKVLKQGTDYSAPVYTMVDEMGESVVLTRQDSVPVNCVITVSVTGLGAYGGSEEVLQGHYRITAKDFGKVKVKSIQKRYTGSSVELTAEDFLDKDGNGLVTFGSGSSAVALEYGKDFEVVEGSYRNNVKKGTAVVTIRGLGEYGGTKTVKFKIGARSLLFWWL